MSFEFFSEESLNVNVDSVLQLLNKDYTVSGGNGSTGSVAISVTGASGGSTVVISLERKEADAEELAQCVREVEALRIQQREVATTTVVTTLSDNPTSSNTVSPTLQTIDNEDDIRSDLTDAPAIDSGFEFGDALNAPTTGPEPEPPMLDMGNSQVDPNPASVGLPYNNIHTTEPEPALIKAPAPTNKTEPAKK